MDGCMTRVTCFLSSCICSLHCQTSECESIFTELLCMHDQSTLFSPHASAHFIANIRWWVYWIVYVWMHKSNLFLSSSAHFIANSRRWVLLNCVCMHGCIKVTCFSPDLLTLLPTSCKRWDCVCTNAWPARVTCFSPDLLTSLPTSAGEFYWIVYV